eukprot:g2651.t1
MNPSEIIKRAQASMNPHMRRAAEQQLCHIKDVLARTPVYNLSKIAEQLSSNVGTFSFRYGDLGEDVTAEENAENDMEEKRGNDGENMGDLDDDDDGEFETTPSERRQRRIDLHNEDNRKPRGLAVHMLRQFLFWDKRDVVLGAAVVMLGASALLKNVVEIQTGGGLSYTVSMVGWFPLLVVLACFVAQSSAAPLAVKDLELRLEKALIAAIREREGCAPVAHVVPRELSHEFNDDDMIRKAEYRNDDRRRAVSLFTPRSVRLSQRSIAG